MITPSQVPQELILQKIYEIRGKKVMLDRDLAALYQVETKYLKRQVKRNLQRFPEDFMFELTSEELQNWRRQIGTSISDSGEKMGLRYAPFAFTEQGVAQLSSVLGSELAIAVNIEIIRLFTRMREVFFNQGDMLYRIDQLEQHMDNRQLEITEIFDALKVLLQTNTEPRKLIGYKTQE